MKKIIFIMIVSFGLYHAYTDGRLDIFESNVEHHNEIIMYSLTTCGYCKRRARELKARNVSFTEYYIDKDKRRLKELNAKLTKAGFKPKSYGTPILDVHGVMLPNNPSMDKILKNLYKG